MFGADDGPRLDSLAVHVDLAVEHIKEMIECRLCQSHFRPGLHVMLPQMDRSRAIANDRCRGHWSLACNPIDGWKRASRSFVHMSDDHATHDILLGQYQDGCGAIMMRPLPA